MTTKELTKLEAAQQTLDDLNQRVQAIAERQAAIPGLLEEQRQKLGIAIIGKITAGAIHREIERLEREARELDAEALALAPHYRTAEKALALAQAEAARERYAALAEEAAAYPRKIFDALHAAFCDLEKMRALHLDMADAEQEAGRLAPITVRPEPGLFIPLGASQAVDQAYRALVFANSKELAAQGFELD